MPTGGTKGDNPTGYFDHLLLNPNQFASNLAQAFSVYIRKYTIVLTVLVPMIAIDEEVDVTILDTTAVFFKVSLWLLYGYFYGYYHLNITLACPT